MKVTYPVSSYGYPTGTSTDIQRAFKSYGLSCSYSSVGTNFDTVKSIIKNNRPIFAGLKTSGGTGHAVVICGYQSVQGGYYYYELMDPNLSSTVLVSVSSYSGSKNFTYATSYGYTFTSWTFRCH